MMADLVDKLFNFICGSGGFVELSVLLKRSSPLGSRKSATEARNWLKSQTEFALVKDGNGEVTGVRIAFRKKLCQQYALKGSCRKKKGMCKHWHICKRFIEGNCSGVCQLSHDFHNEANSEKTKELQLQKYSNGALKNIVAWSLPQVCRLYLKNECKSDKCSYIHVCSQAAKGSSCCCSLSHDLADSHNMKILKEHDLVPSSQVVNVDFVRCSVLVLDEERCVGAQNISSEGATAVTSKTAANKSGTANAVASKMATADAITGEKPTIDVVTTKTADAVTSKTPTASDAVTNKTTTATAATSKSTPSTSDSSAKSRLHSVTPTSLFDRLCYEFNCSASLTLLQEKKVVIPGELEEFLSMLGENQDKFLVARNEHGTVQGITAYCPKLRLCLDFVALNKCKNEGCPYFHLCRKFVTGSCNRGENCGRSHSFRNKRDNKTLLQLKLDGLTNQQLRQLMLLSTPQVCINYNKGKCTDGSHCSQVHICKKFVTNACMKEDRCRLNHKRAVDTQHTRSLLDKYILDSRSCNNVLKGILVCEEQDSHSTVALTISDHDLPTKENVISGVSETASAVKRKTTEANSDKGKAMTTAVTSTIPSAIAVISKVAVDPVTNKISTPAAVANKPAAANFVREKITTANGVTSKALSATVVTSKTATVNAVTRKTAEASSVKAATTNDFTNKKPTADTIRSKAIVGTGVSSKTAAANTVISKARTAATSASKRGSVDAVTDNASTATAVTRKAATAIGFPSKTTTANDVTGKAEKLTTSTSKTATVNAASSKTTTTNADPSKATANAVTSETKAPIVVGLSNSSTAATRTVDLEYSERRSRFSNGAAANVFFDRLCKEFNCSAPFTLLKDQKVVLSNEVEEFLSMLEENQDKFLVTRNERGTVQNISGFCPKLRLCIEYVSPDECRSERCPYFHLCRNFITEKCCRGENCSRGHSFRNKRDQAKLQQLQLEGLTNGQLRQLMLLSTPQVCLDYNKSKCIAGSFCSRVHICKEFVTNICRKEDRCHLDHKQALYTSTTGLLLDKFRLDWNSRNKVLKVMLVCEEHDNDHTHGTGKRMSDSGSGSLSKSDDLVVKCIMDSERQQGSPSQSRKSGQPQRRSSLSSSCSFEAGRDQFSPSKKAVFHCISKQYDGSVSFAVISKRQDLFTDDFGDVATWFREQQESFLLTEDTNGSILQVNVFCPKARLCFDYLFSQNCSRSDCQYFHVCREYIAGHCRFGVRCKWHHNFQFDETRGFILKLELDGLTHEQLRKVLQLSMPQVCLDYNNGCCNRGLSCTQIHICKDFVKKKCEDEEDCGLQHENALLSSRASTILENYGLRCTDGNFKFVLKELIVCDDSSRQSKERRSSSISQTNNWDSKMGTSFAQPSSQFKHLESSSTNISDPCNYSSSFSNESNGSFTFKNSVPTATPCFPTERQVFESLCTEYDCSASFTAIGKRTDLFPHGLESAESWFRRTKGNFLITESDKEKGKISNVEAFSADARLCLHYIVNGTCQKADCQYFHVCKSYISDSCSPGVTCPLNHHFHNDRDKALLSRINLDLFTEEQLRKLTLLSTPQLCVEYNNGICSRGDSCRRIHICCGYLRKGCRDLCFCDLDHELALDTDRAQAVLELLHFRTFSKRDTLIMILDDKLSMSREDIKNCEYNFNVNKNFFEEDRVVAALAVKKKKFSYFDIDFLLHFCLEKGSSIIP